MAIDPFGRGAAMRPAGGTAVMPFGDQPSGPPGGGGGGTFPTGAGGPLYGMPTRGFGLMRPGAGPKGSAMMSSLNPMKWAEMSRQISPGQFQRQEGMAAGADVAYGEQQEAQEREQFDWMRQAQAQRNQLFTQFMRLLQQGSQGGGGDVPMPVQADPRILAGLQAGVQQEFEPMEKQEAGARARGGRTALDSTAAGQRQSLLASRKAGAMSQAYVPAQEATVRGYQPGLESRRIDVAGRIPLLQMLMQSFGMRA